MPQPSNVAYVQREERPVIRDEESAPNDAPPNSGGDFARVDEHHVSFGGDMERPQPTPKAPKYNTKNRKNWGARALVVCMVILGAVGVAVSEVKYAGDLKALELVSLAIGCLGIGGTFQSPFDNRQEDQDKLLKEYEVRNKNFLRKNNIVPPKNYFRPV